MTRNLLVTVIIACVAFAIRPAAQSRPDLSGTWTVSDPADRGVFGRSFTATQNSVALTIESTGGVEPKPDASATSAGGAGKPLSWHFSPPAASSQPQRWSYSMTAEEKRETHPRPSWVDNVDQSHMMWSYMESSTERAVWLGDLLVVTSHAYYKTHWPEHTPVEFPTETTTRLSLSLDGIDKLAVERTVIADPLPGHLNIRIDVPTVRRSVYIKVPKSDSAR